MKYGLKKVDLAETQKAMPLADQPESQMPEALAGDLEEEPPSRRNAVGRDPARIANARDLG